MNDKVIVITGGSGVLCGTMAKHLADMEARVVIIGRNQAKLEMVADQIKSKKGRVLAIAADVLDREAMLAAYEQVNKTFGPCEVLINGAGGNNPQATTESIKHEDNLTKSFFDLDFQAVGQVFDVNFLGTFLPSQVFGRDMLDREGCTIINISSMSAYSPMTKVVAYSAAKAAISNFTEWMAVHFAESGIRVNAIAPGFFLTEQNRTLLTQEDGSLTDRGNTIISQTPMSRFGKPEDLLGTLEWLCDEKRSGFVTGTVIPVDGGFNAFSGV